MYVNSKHILCKLYKKSHCHAGHFPALPHRQVADGLRKGILWLLQRGKSLEQTGEKRRRALKQIVLAGGKNNCGVWSAFGSYQREIKRFKNTWSWE